MTTKRCLDCKTRPVVGGVRGDVSADYCLLCMDYQGAENQHSDEGHDYYNDPEHHTERDEEIEKGNLNIDTCLVCKGEDPKINAPEIKKGHTNGGVKKGTRMTSHAACEHPATKAGRAQCRKQRASEA